MSASHTGPSPAGNGIDLVDKYNARSILFRVFKQVPDAGCAYANEHFHKVGTGDAEKRNSGLAGYRFSQKRLSCSRRAYKDQSLGDPCAYAGVFLRFFQEIHDLFQLFFFFLKACDLFEIYIAVSCHAGAALSKVHHLGIGSAAPGAHIHEHENAHKNRSCKYDRKDDVQHIALLGDIFHIIVDARCL